MSDHIFPDSAHHREGEAGKNCGGCVYFSDGKCDVYDAPTDAGDLCDSYDADTSEQDDMGNGIDMSEMFCSGDHAHENDGLIWKTVLRTGTWKYRPGPGQRPVPDPIVVVPGHSDNPRTKIGLADLVSNFDDKAIEHVTVPKSHQDRVDENTGYTRKLKIERDPEREGHYLLKAGLDFTEPDIKQKVLNRSIANTSCGLYYDYIRKDDGKKYPVALGHIALTNSPWINGMKPFGMSEDTDIEITSLEFSEEMENPELKIENGTLPVTVDGKVYMAPFTWENGNGLPKITFSAQSEWKEQATEEVPPVTDPEKRKPAMSQIPGLEGLELGEDAAAKVAELLAAREAEVTAANEAADALRASNLELAADKHKTEVEAKVSELKDLGLSEQPGFLKVVRTILLSDNGSQKLELSEDGKTEEITFSDVVNKLIDALPQKDGKINFGEQVESLVGDERPPADAAGENDDHEARYAAAHEELYGHKPKTK